MDVSLFSISIDFAEISRDKGMEYAVEDYATDIFTEDSVDSIVRAGGTIAENIREKKAQAKEVTLPNSEERGKIVKLGTPDKPVNLIFDETGQRLIGIQEGGRYIDVEEAVVDIETGQWAIKEGRITETKEDGTKLVTEIGESRVKKISALTPEQEDILAPVEYVEKLSLEEIDEETPMSIRQEQETFDIDAILSTPDYRVTIPENLL